MIKWLVYYSSLAKELVCVLIWLGVQEYLFFDTLQDFKQRPEFASTNALMGSGVAVAKASAAVINYNCAILVASMCQITISWLQSSWLGRIIPFQSHVALHRMASVSILVYSVVHTVAHYVNYTKIPTSWLALAFKTGPGLTGHFLWLSFLVIMTTSFLKRLRRWCYEAFWYTHYLAVIFLLLLSFHGTFCFIKRDFGATCPGSKSWKWLVGPCSLFILELAWREIRSRRFTFVSKVIVHQCGVVEMQIKKPSLVYRPGQYVQISCPEVSSLQWHPFTITSAPEEGFVSVHVRVVGGWTRSFCAALGVEFDEKSGAVSGYSAPERFPTVLLDGPYGSVSESFDRFEVAICIGAGIGQTPFASILKSMWYSITHPTQQLKLKKIIYYGISREVESLGWFLDILRALEEQYSSRSELLEINCFMTGKLNDNQVMFLNLENSHDRPDPLTKLRSKTNYGRPDFDCIFARLKARFPDAKRIGVFYCGPGGLGRKIKSCCVKSSSSKQLFEFFQETF